MSLLLQFYLLEWILIRCNLILSCFVFINFIISRRKLNWNFYEGFCRLAINTFNLLWWLISVKIIHLNSFVYFLCQKCRNYSLLYLIFLWNVFVFQIGVTVLILFVRVLFWFDAEVFFVKGWIFLVGFQLKSIIHIVIRYWRTKKVEFENFFRTNIPKKWIWSNLEILGGSLIPLVNCSVQFSGVFLPDFFFIFYFWRIDALCFYAWGLVQDCWNYS